MNKFKVHGSVDGEYFAVIIYTNFNVQEVFEQLFPMATFDYSELLPDDN